MKVSNKKLNRTLWMIVLATIFLVVSCFVRILFLVSAPFFILTVFFYYRSYRCPQCGKWENLANLMYAKNHVCHCRGCGTLIEIDEMK